MVYFDFNKIAADEKMDYNMPKNQSRIVFSLFTNEKYYKNIFYWGGHPHGYPITFIAHLPQNEIYRFNHSWWHPEQDFGMVTDYFNNVIQAVRIERNWTNYFHLCRDGTYSTSERVRKDSYDDLRALVCNASTIEQLEFIKNDPLVDRAIKSHISFYNYLETLLPEEGCKNSED